MAKAAEYKWMQVGEEYFYYKAVDGKVVGSVGPTNSNGTGKAVVYCAYLQTGENLGYYIGSDAAQKAVACVAAQPLARKERSAK